MDWVLSRYGDWLLVLGLGIRAYRRNRALYFSDSRAKARKGRGDWWANDAWGDNTKDQKVTRLGIDRNGEVTDFNLPDKEQK